MASNLLLLFATCILFYQIHAENLKNGSHESFKDSLSCVTIPFKNRTRLEEAVKKSRAKAKRVYDLIPPNRFVRSAFDQKHSHAILDCSVFYRLTLHHLSQSLFRLNKANADSLIWGDAVGIHSCLSAALTNQDHCLKRLEEANVNISHFPFTDHITNASKYVKHSLALMNKVWTGRKDAHRHSVPKGRLLSDGVNFPWWLSGPERDQVLQSSGNGNGIKADVIVATDGSGHYMSIGKAITAVPPNSGKKYVIYVKAGTYNENVNLPETKTNIMLVGEGKDSTVITGSRSVDQYPMSETATFAVFGDGFIAQDITFENTAGPGKHQAVALLVAADRAAFYRCSIKGHQDTLFAYALNQFYRDTDIYGSVDFICGNAAAVFQNCNLLVRKTLAGASNVVTAQKREDPYQNTGFSFLECQVTATPELESAISYVKTHLGRPWGRASRTVFINSYLGELIAPEGWLEWRGDYSRLYYGEFNNRGPGADTSRRVRWPGFHVMHTNDAEIFTVDSLIKGNEWLPFVGIPFQSGLK